MELWVEKFTNILQSQSSLKTFLLTITLIIIFTILKKVLNQKFGNQNINRTNKILLRKKINFYLNVILFISVFLLWFSQLQVFFVSMFAIAAAIVVALKELIMCFTGGLLVNGSNIFKEGHRIEVNKIRGFVLEKNLWTTRILEIGPESNSQQTTGDIITIPNSVMLSHAVKNESYFRGYTIKSFLYSVPKYQYIVELEELLLNEALNLTDEFKDEAKKVIGAFCAKEGLVVPGLAPRTKVIIKDKGEIDILVKLPVKNTNVAEIEQTLNRLYVKWRIEIGEREKNTLEKEG